MTKTRLTIVALAALALLVWQGALYAADAADAVPSEAPGAVGSNGGSAAYATDATAATDTVIGWVVDANGWLGNGLRGAEHKQDAVADADLGTPLVILTDGGAIVYPVDMSVPSSPKANNNRLDPYTEQRVMVTGRVIDRGLEHAIVIDEVAAIPEPKAAAASVRELPNAHIVARVTDLGCWLGKGEAGAAHAQCAQACAKAGEPLVLVDDAGQLYRPERQRIADELLRAEGAGHRHGRRARRGAGHHD